MEILRRYTPSRHDPRTLTLYLPDYAWTALDKIARRSECSVSEVIEIALHDWANSASVAIKVMRLRPGEGVGSFDVRPEDK